MALTLYQLAIVDSDLHMPITISEIKMYLKISEYNTPCPVNNSPLNKML